MLLREWMMLYVKHRDAYEKKLVHVHENQTEVIFEFRDRTLTGYAMDVLELPRITGPTLIVTQQTRINIQKLIDAWQDFSEHPEITIVFVNLKRHEKWSIKPYLHARITDENLAAGIWTLAESVTFSA